MSCPPRHRLHPKHMGFDLSSQTTQPSFLVSRLITNMSHDVLVRMLHGLPWYQMFIE
jgi:hypothetical protein